MAEKESTAALYAGKEPVSMNEMNNEIMEEVEVHRDDLLNEEIKLEKSSIPSVDIPPKEADSKESISISLEKTIPIEGTPIQCEECSNRIDVKEECLNSFDLNEGLNDIMKENMNSNDQQENMNSNDQQENMNSNDQQENLKSIDQQENLKSIDSVETDLNSSNLLSDYSNPSDLKEEGPNSSSIKEVLQQNEDSTSIDLQVISKTVDHVNMEDSIIPTNLMDKYSLMVNESDTHSVSCEDNKLVSDTKENEKPHLDSNMDVVSVSDKTHEDSVFSSDIIQWGNPGSVEVGSSQETLSVHSDQSQELSSIELPLDSIQICASKDIQQVSQDEIDALSQLLSPHETVSRCVVRHNIVFSESDSPSESGTSSPRPITLFPSEQQLLLSPSQKEENLEHEDIQNKQTQQINSSSDEYKRDSVQTTLPLVHSSLPDTDSSMTSPSIPTLSHPASPSNSISSPSEQQLPVEEVITPPRSSMKRPIQVDNEPEQRSPMHFISAAVPIPPESITTPKKKQCTVSTVSPTKVVEDTEPSLESEKVAFKPYDISLFAPLTGQKIRQPLRVKRLLKELSDERNRFRAQFRMQITGLWTSFQIECKQCSTVSANIVGHK